jgi:hypothetical protein
VLVCIRASHQPSTSGLKGGSTQCPCGSGGWIRRPLQRREAAPIGAVARLAAGSGPSPPNPVGATIVYQSSKRSQDSQLGAGWWAGAIDSEVGRRGGGRCVPCLFFATVCEYECVRATCVRACKCAVDTCVQGNQDLQMRTIRSHAPGSSMRQARCLLVARGGASYQHPTWAGVQPPPCYTGHRRTPRLSSHPRSRGLASAPPVRVRIPAAGPPATPVTNRIGSTLPHTHHHSLPLSARFLHSLARSLPSPHPTQPAFPPYLSRISPSISKEKGSFGYFQYTSSFVLSFHHYQPSPHPFLPPPPSLPPHLSTSIPFSLAHPPTLP